MIDSSIGEGSAFHELYGYYAQGVGEGTAVLPAGWRDRLVRVSNPNASGITGLCLEVHDLAISKYVAGREKDLEFTRELAKHRMTDKATLQAACAKRKWWMRFARWPSGELSGPSSGEQPPGLAAVAPGNETGSETPGASISGKLEHGER